MKPFVSVLGVILAAVLAVPATAADIHDCDRLAADPADRERMKAVSGVVEEHLDLEAASAACEAAVLAFPDVARFHYQVARVRWARSEIDPAMDAYERAAALGHAQARQMAVRLHALLLVYPEGRERSLEYLRLEALKGDALAQIALVGFGLSENAPADGSYDENSLAPGTVPALAFQQLNEGSNTGNGLASHILAELYLFSFGRKLNDPEVVAFFRLSAEQGYAPGQDMYGGLLLEGHGVEQNPRLAAYWLEEAARQGVTRAQVNLARLLMEGEGVEKDLVRAYAWLLRAGPSATQGQSLRVTIEKKLTDTQREQARKLADTLGPG